MIGVCHGAKLYLAKYKWEGFFASESSCVKRPVFSPCEPLPAGAGPQGKPGGEGGYQTAVFFRWFFIPKRSMAAH